MNTSRDHEMDKAVTISPPPLVTIAIPTYNRADGFLRQALESARNQTYPKLDIIVSDNCSPDNTATLVTNIADPRIRYFKHHVNIGSNNNFNFCLKEARGDYFLLLCDDDLIDDDFIETCMKAAKYSSDVGIIRTGTRVIDANNQLLRESPNMVCGDPIDAFFRGWFSSKTALYLCSMLFNTERLRGIGGFMSKYNLYDDVVAGVQLAAKYGRIDIQDIKATARLHESKLSFAEDTRKWCEEALILLDLMCELVSENRALVRRDGMRFFARANYSRASAVRSPLKRFIAYMIVFKEFNYRYYPSLYPQRLRGIKGKTKRLLSMSMERRPSI
jgi:glycosyltransferase involved in cell wall biosynthesis